MPSLYKRPNSPYWWLTFTVNGGERRSSTGISHNGRKRPCPVAAEILRATEERLARAKFGLAPMVEQRSVKAFFNELLATYTGHSERSKGRYISIIKHFEAWAAKAGLNSMAEISSPRAIQYVDASRRKEGGSQQRDGSLGPITLRSYVAFMRVAMEEARKRNCIQFEDNPFAIKVKVPKSHRTAFSTEQLAAILKMECPQWLAMVNRIALCTAARVDSIRNLWGEHIGFDLGIINFQVSKTGPYSCPLHPELAAYLKPLVGTGPILPQEVLDRSLGYISTQFTGTVQKQCGFYGTLHMFRHTLTTLMASAGIEKRIAMLVTNHTDADVHDAYTHVQASQLVPHLERLRFGI